MLTLPLKAALIALALTVSLTGAALLVASPNDESPPPLAVTDGSPPPAPPAPPSPEPPDEPVEAEPEAEKHPLDQKVTVDFDNRELMDVLQFVTDSTGIPFEFAGRLDPDREHRVVSLKATDITLRSMLELVCLTSRLTWKLTPDGAIRVAALPDPPATRTTRKDGRWFGAIDGMFSTPERTEVRLPPEVALPEADMAQPLPVDLLESAIQIAVGADGTRFHGEQDLSDDYALWLLLLLNPDAPVVIFADENAPVARIQRVRSLAGHARAWLATRGGTGLVLPGGAKPTGDLVILARMWPRKFAHGTSDPLGVYQAFWRIHQANAGKVIVLRSVLDQRSTVSHLTVLVNEASRFGWPISLSLPQAASAPETLYFTVAPPPGTPLEQGEVPELQPSVALGRYPASTTPGDGESTFRYSRWFLTRNRKGHRNLRAEGGGAATWRAVNLGLRWLSLQQQKDGSFGDGGAGTALVMQAFLAEGVGVREELKQYEDVLNTGLAWLEKHNASDGPATMAFAEAYALTGDSRWLSAAEKAAKEAGSGLALRIARFCGVPVTIPDAEVVGESPVACLTRLLDGNRPWVDEDLDRSIRLFTEPVKDNVSALTGMDSQFLHDATLVAFQVGSGAWWHWLRAMKQALVSTQHQSGPEAGSWPRRAGESRIRDTALNVATLTVFYRYARLFRR